MPNSISRVLFVALLFTACGDDSDRQTCASSPCFNGGACANRDDSFVCTCPEGFSGSHCETNIDDCAAEPCANGGVCVDRTNGYQCACAAGFTGATCDAEVDACATTRCFGHGTCVAASDGFTCNCEANFFGEQCEAYMDQLVITGPDVVTNAIEGQSYAVSLSRTGGTSRAVWSIAPSSANTAWLTINAQTGALSGTPSAADEGAVTLTVRVAEAAYPTNFAERTYTFAVTELPAASYTTDFEGACPNGWTLMGDWECGTPVNVGPAAANSGTQCLGTKIAGNYSDGQTYASCTATSPAIALATDSPKYLHFATWFATEGSTYDGFHLELSNNDGASYTVVTTVTPTYPLVIDGAGAWGGGSSGWQTFGADLSAYAGTTVRLRFAFRSDSSGNFPGVYIDDVTIDAVNGN